MVFTDSNMYLLFFVTHKYKRMLKKKETVWLAIEDVHAQKKKTEKGLFFFLLCFFVFFFPPLFFFYCHVTQELPSDAVRNGRNVVSQEESSSSSDDYFISFRRICCRIVRHAPSKGDSSSVKRNAQRAVFSSSIGKFFSLTIWAAARAIGLNRCIFLTLHFISF